MTKQCCLLQLGVFLALIAVPGLLWGAERNSKRLKAGEFNPDHETVELFKAMDDGTIEVTYIPQNAQAANILIKNMADRPLNVRLPEAFAGVPVLAQFGMGGGGGGGGGGQGQGGGLGGGGGGGGGGFFNVAAEKVGKIKVDCVCLDHGKPDPNPRMKYEIKPVESYVSNAEVIELLKMLGNGQLDLEAAQAATWHLNNGLTWQELVAKTNGRKRLIGGEEPYFQSTAIRTAMLIAQEVKRRAQSAPQQSPGKSDSLSEQ